MSQPNVLLVCTDHWPASLLGCAGHSAILTPTLDQLALNGVRFENAYSECPMCVPARRTLMTGLAPHTHGMLTNGPATLPDVPTIAEAFRGAGYQTCAAGKMHWTPQRQRRGFEELLLDEEGRGNQGCGADDYELFLGDEGHPGERFGGGMPNNSYAWRPWHLAERQHATHWTARQTCRQIVRRDPQRPAFWYCSFSHPHPPLVPLRDYLDIYRGIQPPDPVIGAWIDGDPDRLPPALQRQRQQASDHGWDYTADQVRDILRAFYALCTHIDHQFRVILGTLRDRGLLGNTIVCFTSDHGDMLGNHRFWAKGKMYEASNNVPMILAGTDRQRADGVIGHHRVDDRLVATRDIMPTLLDLAGIEIPPHCEGLSMLGAERRDALLGAHGVVEPAENPTRMLRTQRHKLVYYPVGNLRQLFDIQNDRMERYDLADDASHADTLEALSQALLAALPAEERAAWAPGGQLAGWPGAGPAEPQPNPSLDGQRGIHWPHL